MRVCFCVGATELGASVTVWRGVSATGRLGLRGSNDRAGRQFSSEVRTAVRCSGSNSRFVGVAATASSVERPRQQLRWSSQRRGSQQQFGVVVATTGSLEWRQQQVRWSAHDSSFNGAISRFVEGSAAAVDLRGRQHHAFGGGQQQQ